MKYQILFFALLTLLTACTSSSIDQEKESLEKENAQLKKELELLKSQVQKKSQKATPIEKPVVEPSWNYSGQIGDNKIKCNLIFESSDNKFWNPVTGYYFYENKKEKITVRGQWHNGNLKIQLREFVNEKKGASFEGKIDDPALKKVITGTWTFPGKHFGFTLTAK
jgi:hypothetical protein